MARMTLRWRAAAHASLIALALCGAFGAWSDVAAAQAPESLPPGIDPIDIPPEHDPLAHAWDRPNDRGGFYLRATFALGYNSTRLGPPSWDDENYQGLLATGFGTGFGLDLGGLLAPWLALHASLHAGVLWNGDLEREFAVYNEADARVAAYGVGPAATFFTPLDFYFTTAFGVGIARVQHSGDENTTNPGFYMNLVAGNDVYHGRNCAFGLQFQIVYMLLGDDRAADEARVRQYLFGASFAYDSI